jgi:hypothetical protein
VNAHDATAPLVRVQLDDGFGNLVDVEVLAQMPGDRAHVRFVNSGAHMVVPARLLVVDGDRYDTTAQARDAAAFLEGPVRLTDAQLDVLRALGNAGHYGLTDDEHENLNGLRGDSAGKRRLELKRMNLVEDTTYTRLTRRGAPARVWRITARGEWTLARALARAHPA